MPHRLLAVFVLLAATAAPAAASIPDGVLHDILIHEQARNGQDGVLAALTQDKNPDVRARAYRALGRLQDPALLETLAHGLTDSKEPVREEAAFAVGQLFDSTAAVSALREAYPSEKSLVVRTRLIEALGKCGDSGTVSFLAGLLGSAESPLAYQAAQALGVLAARGVSIESSAPQLRLALMSPDPDLRWRAAFAVQRGKVKGAVTGLMRALKEKDSLTLIFASRAATALGVKTLTEYAVPLLKNEDWRVRVEALRVLGACKGDFYASQASLLLDDHNPHVMLTAIATMGKLADGGGLGRLKELSDRSDWRIRGAILKANAVGSGDGSLGDLIQILKDPDWHIRYACAEALGSLKSEQALLLMEKMTNDESPQVATAVVNSLVTFPQRHAAELLRSFLDSGDPAVLTGAANAVGQRFDRSAVPGILAAYDKLQSPVDTEVMTALLDALGAILSSTPADDPIGSYAPEDSSRAMALLEAARHDTDVNVAAAAARARARITGEEVPPAAATSYQVPAEFDIDLAMSLATGSKKPVAHIVTDEGTITIRLLGEDAPGTVANFVTLVRRGFYNGLTFHRVVADFVTQGGDPRGDGWGGPGYTIRCEYNPVPYGTGTVGMALSGKDTGGSQFFITHSPQPHLDGKYTVFGEVTEGMTVLDQIEVGDVINEITLDGI
jgi:cyclophilin family peptidyl-prolyl cis-trans isomerase/HEAT repeat protein